MSRKTVADLEFKTIDSDPENVLSRAEVNNGEFITVLFRRTGFGSDLGMTIFDTETGYRNKAGSFWLASGDFDIREFPELTITEAIQRIKDNANTCVGE